ncbi:MAG TPA: hypothetical protein DDW52_17495, partial [Planctomycetaceae bacterium]|nr:hypothetical protein [Planctomycetaceae bacterium]
MLSFRLFLLVLVTLICRECTEPVPSRTLTESLVATLGLTLGFALAFKTLTLICLLRRNTGVSRFELSQGPAHLRDAHLDHIKLRDAVLYVWIAALPAVYFAAGLGQWISTIDSGTLGLLSWFAPTIALLLLLELTSSQFEEVLAEASRQLRTQETWPSRFKENLISGDLPALAICLLPVVSACLLSDTLSLFDVDASSTLGAIAVAASSLALFVIFLPILLAKQVGATPIQNPSDAKRLEDLIARVGLRRTRLLETRRDGHGAAAVGFMPGVRQLWLSRLALERLSEAEVDMVLLHEAAHLRRGHCYIRLTPILAAAAIMLVGVWIASQFGPDTMLTGHNTGNTVRVFTIIATFGLLLAGLSWVSHRCEYDADRRAVM